MIVSASLSDASIERVISSEVTTGMPAWGSHRNQFVYSSERSGSSAIWMRNEDGDRPIVTADAFPSASKSSLILPTLSPQADRVLYTRGTGGSNDQFIARNVHRVPNSSISTDALMQFWCNCGPAPSCPMRVGDMFEKNGSALRGASHATIPISNVKRGL